MAIWRSCGRSATVPDPKAPQMGKACDSIMWQPAMGEAPWFSCTRGKLISQPQTPRHHWTYSLHEFEDCGLTIISFSTPTHGFPESPSDSGPQLKASLKGKNSKHFQPLYLEKIYGGSSATHSPHSFSTPWETPAVLNLHTFPVTDANVLRQSNAHHPAALLRSVAAHLRIGYPAVIPGQTSGLMQTRYPVSQQSPGNSRPYYCFSFSYVFCLETTTKYLSIKMLLEIRNKSWRLMDALSPLKLLI